MVTVPQESLMRWTVGDVRRMVESGGFAHPERFELVEGLLLKKMGQNEPHILAVLLTLRAFRAVYAANDLASATPLALSEGSTPEPDVMVLRAGWTGAPKAEDALLVVEVSDSSLRIDQTTKAALYARHGIPEYVILDVTNHRAEIRRKPDGEDWGETLILTESGEFTPLGANASIRVKDLFGEA